MPTSISYSIIIPAYNEEEWLPATLASVRESMACVERSGEVIVVDNNSADRTAEIAQEYGATVVFESINQISRARNTGANAADGQLLIFLDADTFLSREILDQALANLQDKKCCGGGALVEFDKPLPKIARFFTNMWNWLSAKRSLAAGSFVYCLREAFDDVGGFSESVYASEEIWISRALAKWGRNHGMKFKIITDPHIVSSSRKIDWYSPMEMLFVLVILTVFPFAVRFRSLCSFWYRRP